MCEATGLSFPQVIKRLLQTAPPAAFGLR